ncbi:hypothetical protein Lpar_1561 [Legionella parisiensis]|uniref:Uncharacterized protein n=2 Tax=Legionella parisiensis TaxID=45071 RepID=A0A1E5JRS7_9GAMM|nr:hypothetical protein Lpar_1561 [Legionella parisiensis]OEH46748.1 hypothetical protein lpari_02216 [Legionella parisiensis]STX77644.1 Uncharacterised protein [Legionella parisiensis]
MILKSLREKTEFLEECLFHIDHIFNRVINKNSPKITLQKKSKSDNQGKHISVDTKLPDSIIIKGALPDKNFDAGKLIVLTSLYNHIALRIKNKNTIDLGVEFNRVKQKLHFTLLKYGLPSADILMKKHRNHFLRKGILEYILSFIWTSPSSEFLNKYEFFTKASDSEDNFNFCYELAENCQFDVNLISKIEPIGKGLGYIIKAKSTVEAAIIMNAIRKQLSAKKLEDSIRYIDTLNRSAQDESSSTIEIWGQAVDMLNNLKDESIRKF